MCLASSTHGAKLESRCWDLRSYLPQKQDKSPSPVQMCHGSGSLCTEAAVFWVPSSETPTGTLHCSSILKRARNRRYWSTYLITLPPVNDLKQSSYKHAGVELFVRFGAIEHELNEKMRPEMYVAVFKCIFYFIFLPESVLTLQIATTAPKT